MRAFPEELAIMNLTGSFGPGDPEYMPIEEAWQVLREDCPVDFGEDLSKWAEWVDQTYTAKRRAAINSKK